MLKATYEERENWRDRTDAIKLQIEFTPEQVAGFLLALAVALAAVGYTTVHTSFSVRQLLEDFYANFSTEFFSIFITVFVIDWLNKRRLREERKRTLIAQLGSPSNDFAVEAARLLRIEGWGLEKDTSLQGAELWKAKLMDANLRLFNLAEASFTDSNLEAADLGWANLENASLADTFLHYVNLSFANLRNASLSGSDLVGASLIKTNLTGATLINTDLENACLWGANLTEAYLYGAALEGAEFNKETILPDGTNWTPGTDLGQFNDSEHPEFWVPKRIKKLQENEESE